MSIFDAIKKSVLEGFSSDITLIDIALALGVAFLAGLFILLIYRLTLKGISRNRTFEVTVILITPISAMIVLTITSNLALSLGMVAIKDASDTVFLFWAVAAGITAGAHFYKITIIGCLFIGLAAFIILKLSSAGARPYLLVVRASNDTAIEYTSKILGSNRIKNRLSSLVQNGDYTEVIYEIALPRSYQKLVSALGNVPDIVSVSLVDCRN